MKQTALQDSTERPPGSAAWKLVPLEPTPEMVSAAASTPGMKAIDNSSALMQLRGYPIDRKHFEAGSPLVQAWRAMLAVAPEPPRGAAAPLHTSTSEPDKQDQGVERAALREALEELVALEDLKAEIARLEKVPISEVYKEGYPGTIAPLRDEYERRKGPAWKAARAALAAHPGVV